MDQPASKDQSRPSLNPGSRCLKIVDTFRISQNRTAAASDKRADLDLHINLLTEHELTKLSAVVLAIAARLDVRVGDTADIQEIQADVAPEAVLDELDTKAKEGAN